MGPYEQKWGWGVAGAQQCRGLVEKSVTPKGTEGVPREDEDEDQRPET